MTPFIKDSLGCKDRIANIKASYRVSMKYNIKIKISFEQVCITITFSECLLNILQLYYCIHFSEFCVVHRVVFSVLILIFSKTIRKIATLSASKLMKYSSNCPINMIFSICKLQMVFNQNLHILMCLRISCSFRNIIIFLFGILRKLMKQIMTRYCGGNQCLKYKDQIIYPKTFCDRILQDNYLFIFTYELFKSMLIRIR